MGLRFLAVLAESLKSLAVGAPFEPGLRIFSPDPAAIRFRFAAMLAYKPRFLRMVPAVNKTMLLLFLALAFGLFLTTVAVMSGHWSTKSDEASLVGNHVATRLHLQDET